MNYAELAEASGISEQRLRELYPNLKIDEDFDVDAFLKELEKLQDTDQEPEQKESAPAQSTVTQNVGPELELDEKI